MRKRLQKILLTAFAISLMLSGKAIAQPPEEQPNYQAMAKEIRHYFEASLNSYQAGEIELAKSKAQSAYFEVFENLEGPIRSNISAEKAHELESEFGAIRKMINEGEPKANVEARIDRLLLELDETVQALERGYQPVASIKSDLPGLPVLNGTQVQHSESNQVAEKDWPRVQRELVTSLQKGIDLYQKGDASGGIEVVQDSYFDLFEASGMESRIGALDARFKSQLESHFSLLIGQMKKGLPPGDLKITLNQTSVDLEKAVDMLDQGNKSLLALFFYALMIVVREGFEAILIITAILAYLIKTDHQDKVRVIYSACISALVLSVLTAVLLKWVFRASSASQEVLEGISMLLAAVVLFSISYWLISKTEAQKWTAYLKNKVSRSLSSGSLKTLWFTAFLAVYREGAETVLFFQALGVNASTKEITTIVLGFAIGCLLLVGIYLLMRFSSMKLPLRPFFMVTGALLYYMAFVFMGKGVMELVEGKILEPSLISWGGTVPFLGIYPYWQTLLPQLFLVLAAILAFAVMLNPKRRQHASH